jgi:hypothetical protein
MRRFLVTLMVDLPDGTLPKGPWDIPGAYNVKLVAWSPETIPGEPQTIAPIGADSSVVKGT